MNNANPDFMQSATNVYRTKNFIVKQTIGIQYGVKSDNLMFSDDTYYVRTPERDAQYMSLFAGKHNPNGRRIATAMNSRKYID